MGMDRLAMLAKLSRDIQLLLVTIGEKFKSHFLAC